MISKDEISPRTGAKVDQNGGWNSDSRPDSSNSTTSPRSKNKKTLNKNPFTIPTEDEVLQKQTDLREAKVNHRTKSVLK
jgi:hypothetical protein